MKRIYHHYTKWEDYKNGFYNHCSKKDKPKMKAKVLRLFNDRDLTMKYMKMVINEWEYSCEQNLSNESMNRIAYLGQAACNMYAKIPNIITMNVWSDLPENVRFRSDNIANLIIKEWEQRQKYKNTLKNGSKKDMRMGYQMKLQLKWREEI